MTYNPFSLKNKKVLVTGASSGIGRSVAIKCSKMGAEVIITARNKAKLNETFQLLEKNNNHLMVLADLSVQEDIEKLVVEIPSIDGFVSNAGIIKLIPVKFYTQDEIDNIFKVNIFAPMMLTKNLVKSKKLNNSASVVFTSSINGISRVSPANGIYASTKSALDAFMRTSALELASKGIRCNSVNPAMIETGILDKDGAVSAEQIGIDISKYPLKRYGKPEEVAHAIIFLLSDASSWITGTSLKIDGGRTLE